MDQVLEQPQSIQQEIELNQHPNYQLGSYLYMGMALKKGKKVCIAVAYTLSYAIKKSKEFLDLDRDLCFEHISKVKVGEKAACCKFHPEISNIHS